MGKFINHVDHVCWLSRPENIEQHVDRLKKLSGMEFQFLEREDMGIIMYFSWEGGLEVIAPSKRDTEMSLHLRDWLESRGEGVYGVVFGVKSLEQQEQRLATHDIVLGGDILDHPNSPWRGKLTRFTEKVCEGPIMNTVFALSDIAYRDGVVTFEEEE